MAAQKGTIKRLILDRGFGFLTSDDGTEYFFHRSALAVGFELLREGQAIQFEADPMFSPKGPRAHRVSIEP